MIEDFIVSIDSNYIRETNVTQVEYDTDDEVPTLENDTDVGVEEITVPV